MLTLVKVWLNGGPGCSSLEGFLQENGPFLWQYGTYQPVKNNWAWSNLTNVVWVEQPAGTGFSHVGSDGAPKDEVESAAQFLGFFKNFMDTFALYVLITDVFTCAQNADTVFTARVARSTLQVNPTQDTSKSALHCCAHWIGS